ncbi:flagellar basal body-associated FliL family protein [Sphingomonas sp.]|uniref:flagellar basal body-associated FliL family protein n=1 Tax=Sphingomonas sp. TaxID=28214 RepID=UPI001B26940E|nr:flagellar basal body-associated FliL family protein [Sphingomonas sp.]MBO9713509.1 flagellar basal body-associated FliL family protein [Sphingomonas sp.]
MSPEIVEEAELPALAPGAPAPAKSKKKLIIIGAAAAVVLLGGGGAGYMVMAGGAPTDAKAEAAHAKKESKGHGEGDGKEGEAAYIDVPPMVVNLRSPDGGSHFLKLHFNFVPGPAGDEATIKDKLPLVLDSYQPFLRELRPEDLSGSAAVFRVKEELMRRTTAALGPDVVSDILIQDLVQQ